MCVYIYIYIYVAAVSGGLKALRTVATEALNT